MSSPCTATRESSPSSLQLEKAHVQQQRPSIAIINWLKSLSYTNDSIFWRILPFLQQTLSSCELEWLTSTLCFFSPFMPTGKKQHANWCPRPNSWQPLSKDTWFLLSNHTSNTSADLSASVKAGRREHLLNANYVPGLGFHIIALHHISCLHSPTHLNGRRDSKWSISGADEARTTVMAVITWEASLSTYQLIQQFHF